jgi:hypothetical protein
MGRFAAGSYLCTPRAGDVFICALPPALVELIGTPDAADPTDDSEIVPDEAPDFRRLLRTRTSGLPEPLPAMPYALVATDGRLFAGLADGQLWEAPVASRAGTPARSKGTRSCGSTRSSMRPRERSGCRS